MKALLIFMATMAPSFAQDLGADPATANLVKMGTEGGFFILAMYWMRTDQQRANERIDAFCREALQRLERAYTSKKHDE